MRYRMGDLVEQVTEVNSDLKYGLNDIVGVTLEKQMIPMLLISSVDLNYLRNIHIVRRVFLVVSGDHILGNIFDGKLLLEELPADERILGFLKGDAFVEESGGQPGVVHLVHIPAGSGAQNAQYFFVLLRVEADGKVIIGVDEFVGISGCPDVNRGNRLAPDGAQTAPAYGHGVEVVGGACGNQCPHLIELRKNIGRKFHFFLLSEYEYPDLTYYSKNSPIL